MAKSQILDYFIHLTDKDRVEELQAQLEGAGGPDVGQMIFNPATGKKAILRAPTGAADEFSAPIQEENVTFAAPCIRSPWFVPSTNNFPRDVATFTRKSGGWFGLPVLFGSTTRFYWAGHPVYSQPATGVQDGTGAVIPRPARIPQRYFLSGGVLPGGEGATGAMYGGPAGGRFPGSWGYTQRQAQAGNTILTQPYTGLGLHTVWERVYIRWRRMPTTRTTIWGTEHAATSGQGFRIDMSSTGGLSWYEKDGGALIASHDSGIVAHRWYRLDICSLFIGESGPPLVRVGKLQTWLNGVSIARVSHSSMGGLVGNLVLSNSVLGKDFSETQVGEFDAYGWRSADIPEDKNPTIAEWASGNSYTVGDVVQTTAKWGYPGDVVAWRCKLTHGSPSPTPGTDATKWERLSHSKDWNTGSRIEIVRPTAAAGDHADWTGDFQRVLNRTPSSQIGAAQGLTSTTSGAVLSMTTDGPDLMKLPGALGITSLLIALHGHRGTTDGTLGYNLNGAGNVMQAITQPAAGAPAYDQDRILYAPAATDEPVAVTSLVIRHVKGADVSLATAYQIAAAAEVIGIFGPEDVPPGAVDADDEPIEQVFPVFHAGQHNAPYHNSPWARSDSRALAPIGAIGGTYVGNATVTELTFRVPVHYLWVRRVTGTTDTGWRWFSTQIAGFLEHNEGVLGNIVARAEVDPTFVPAGGEDDQAQRYRVRITGSHAQVNANAVTYQYIALSDPGARLMMAGAFLKDDHANALTLPVKIENAEFTPEAMLTHSASRSTTTGNTGKFKGHGHATNAGIAFPTTAEPALATFAAGSLESVGADLVELDPENIAYLLFRTNDGSGDANIHKFVSVTSYTGDGTASRTVNFAPATGLRPLFAIVAGSGGGSTFWRDPSYTGTNSGNLGSGTQAATGITGGGIDSLSVGSSLNSNGVLFSVIVIWGSATAGNGGWSINGEFLNIEPGTEGGVEDEPVIVESPDEDDPGDPDEDVPLPDIDDDLADAACVGPTTRVVNLALQRIGINKPIGTLATEQSPAAAAVRLVYDDVLQEVLRALPWDFATRYTNLTLDDGSVADPVNGDWTFAYDEPSNCLFPRRIVAARGSAVNPTPPPMRVGGRLIFTNQANAQLEHTARVSCPATAGDATFRSAWAWRLAAELAPSLSRMADRATYCMTQYGIVLAQAAEFIRLGNPGHPPAADPTDPDLTCLAVKLDVINAGLIGIGCRTIASLDEQSRESVAVAVVYEREVRATLRDFPWDRFTAYAAALTLVDGSVSDYANADWVYAYRAPTDMLFARRIPRDLATTGVGRRWEREPAPYRLGSDTDGVLIFTNEEDAQLEYTVRKPIDKGDDLFLNALGWRLAAAVAPSLSVQEPDAEEQTGRAASKEPRRSEGGNIRRQQQREGRADFAWRMYLRALALARSSNANEQQKEPHDLQGDPDWITGR